MTNKTRTKFIFLHCFFFFSAANATELDWFPRESLTDEQQASVNQYCQGRYIDQWQASQGDDTRIFADVIIRTGENRLRLQGGAEIRQANQSFQADNIEGELNRNYQLSGNVISRQKGQLIKASDATINKYEDKNDALFNNAEFLFHNSKVRGEAGSIHKTQHGLIFIEEGFYTTCEPGSGSWQMYGSSIELNPETGFGTAKHVQIRVDGFPVFYFPWMRFPIDERRQTGFLFPEFGYSGSDGASISAPYYLNLAPQLDATITSHFVEHEGEGFDLELRHLSPYGLTTYEESSFFQKNENRQSLRKLASNQVFTSELSADLLIEDNPTENKVPEVSTISLDEEDHYERSLTLNYQTGSFSSDVSVKRYQTPLSTEDQPLEWKPRVNVSYDYYQGVINYNPSAQFTQYEDPDETSTDGARSVLNQDLFLDLSNQWGFVKPGLLHQYRHYDLHSYSSDTDYSTDLNHLSYYLDSGISFERRLNLGEQSWRQTLTPNFNYLYSPYKDQSDIPDFDASEKSLTYSQAFSNTRFSGNDWIGDTEQFTLGIESKLYDANNNERFSFKLGQIFYLRDRQFDEVDTSKESALLSEMTYQHNELFSASLALNYSTLERDLEMGKLSTSLTTDTGIHLNTSYLYSIDEDTREADTKQTSISTIIPLSHNWTLMYQEDYDFIDEVRTKKAAAFGFENCCVKAQLSYLHWRDDDEEFQKGLYLKFILRSLSTLGRESETSSINDTYWNSGQIGYE